MGELSESTVDNSVKVGNEELCGTAVPGWDNAAIVTPMNAYQIEVRDKGRIVIPVELRHEYQLDFGTPLSLLDLGDGDFLVSTREAIYRRMWSGIESSDSTDGVDTLREWRQESETRRRAQLDEVHEETGEENVAAQRLLAALGLSS